MRHWPFIAIFVGNVLAAGVLFFCGRWVGETNRYDGCKLIDAGQVVFYACPVQPDPQPVREPGEGEA